MRTTQPSYARSFLVLALINMADETNGAVILREEDVPGAKLTKSPASCSNVELKRWLECRGAKKSGKKAELVERVEGYFSIGKQIDPKVDGGKWYQAKAAKQKQAKTVELNAHDGNAGEKALKETTAWQRFPSRNLPSMYNYGHVYHYLVESVPTGDDGLETDEASSMTAKPLKKGRNLLKSGFIEDIQDSENPDHYFVRAHVQHSMKKELPLSVKVLISKASGFIKKATCTCIARSLGRCSHVAAVLLHLSDYVAENGHMVQVPKTSQPCTWNKGSKRKKDPKALHKATYKSQKRKSCDALYNWNPMPKKYQGVIDNERKNKFISDLQRHSAITGNISMWETVLRYTYEDFEPDFEHQNIIKELVNQFKDNLQDQCDKLCGTLLSCSIPGTDGQSQSDAWFNCRWPRLTASKCHKIFILGRHLLDSSNRINQLAYNFIRKQFWFKQHIKTVDMQYGIDEEPAARKAYFIATGKKLAETGLWIHRQYPVFGASPDGLIENETDGKVEGIAEIKCLKILRTRTVEELISTQNDEDVRAMLKGQCFRIIDDKLTLKHNHSYYYQIQLQLLVTGFPYCNFILHSPKGPPSIEKILPNAELQRSIIEKAYAFWEQVLVPEYFLMKVPRELYPFILQENIVSIEPL